MSFSSTTFPYRIVPFNQCLDNVNSTAVRNVSGTENGKLYIEVVRRLKCGADLWSILRCNETIHQSVDDLHITAVRLLPVSWHAE